MEKFIVIHSVSPDLDQDEVWEGCHKVATSAVRGAKWLGSYFLPESEELICEWEAPEKAAIRESIDAANGQGLIPIKHIYSAVHLDPEFFK
jgi:hypothetical protein